MSHQSLDELDRLPGRCEPTDHHGGSVGDVCDSR